MANSDREDNGEDANPEKLAMIHAAMMVLFLSDLARNLRLTPTPQEELGIGRKDTLPLEDRGYKGPIHDVKNIMKPLRTLDPNDAAAKWRSKLTFFLSNVLSSKRLTIFRR